MDEEQSEQPYLHLKELLNEKLIITGIVFLLLYLFTLSQGWRDILFLLFPIVVYAFSFFFSIITTNKQKIRSSESPLIYSPLGSERKSSFRLYFVSILLLIILFWIGAESLYHPQLILTYGPYFQFIFAFLYSFGFFVIFVDIWKFCRIAVEISEEDLKENSAEMENIISVLSIKKYKLITIINLLIFLLLNILNIIVIILIELNLISGIHYYLPGTGIESSQPISISFVNFLIFIVSPLVLIVFLTLINKDVSDFNKEDLNKVMNKLPKNCQRQIIENFKTLNKRFLEERET